MIKMNSFTLLACHFVKQQTIQISQAVFPSFVASLVTVQASLSDFSPTAVEENEQVLKLLLNYLNSDTILFWTIYV